MTLGPIRATLAAALASKVVQETIDWSLWIESSIRAHHDELARRLEDHWRHLVPESEDFPDLGRLLDVMADDLAHRRTALIDAEDRHLQELAHDALLCGRRDAAVSEMSAIYVNWRNLYENSYFRPRTVALGFEFGVEEHPSRLAAQVQRLVRNLVEKAPAGAEEPERGGPEAAISPGYLLRGIEPPFRVLSALLQEIRSSRLRLQKTLLAKNATLALLKTTNSSTGKSVEMFLLLAGMKDAARRIRKATFQASRRRSKT